MASFVVGLVLGILVAVVALFAAGIVTLFFGRRRYDELDWSDWR